MAKVISYYRAEAGGSSTMYYYDKPDNSSNAVRIYTGTIINLVADYASRMSGSFYLMQAPKGWIHWYHVQNITPEYKTVLDPCTPPTSLSLDAETKILTITGGDGGDLNAFSGFGVSFRERSVNETVWEEWSEDTAVTGRVVSVTVNAGKVRQYRVRTLGEAGSEHYSEYVLCQDMLNGNIAAGTPVILLPLAGAKTCAGVAAFLIDCPAEPDGDAMTLQRSLDSGAWTDVTGLASTGGLVTDLLALTQPTHTVRYRLMDANGAIGGEDGIAIRMETPVWLREIAAGDVIANQQISFVDDLNQLHQLVNTLRAFYGLSDVLLPGAAGRFGDAQEQLTAMQSAVDGCRSATGRAAYGFETVTGFPEAAQIARLKQAVTQT